MLRRMASLITITSSEKRLPQLSPILIIVRAAVPIWRASSRARGWSLRHACRGVWPVALPALFPTAWYGRSRSALTLRAANHGSYRMDYRPKSLLREWLCRPDSPPPSCTVIAGHIRVAPHDCNISPSRQGADRDARSGSPPAHHSWYASRAGYEYFRDNV